MSKKKKKKAISVKLQIIVQLKFNKYKNLNSRIKIKSIN